MREICQKKGILRGAVSGEEQDSVCLAGIVSGRSLSGCGLLRISGISRAGSGRCCLCRRRREKDDDSGKGALPWSGAGHEEQVFYGFGSGKSSGLRLYRDGVYLLQGQRRSD